MPEVPASLRAALAGRYTLERELGHGGMATVYLAQDLRHHRPVALKVLRPALAAVLGPDRFLREIELAARLTHPHILPVHDSGEADGFLYYVMPFVEGESLRERLSREKQLPLEDAVRLACEVADALSHAHSHDVVHRDIKPENVLLEAGHAVVTDFGIARAITEAGRDRLTETGIVLGTPTYMSPEQAAGERELDGRSDLYSLGCVLFEMLAGQPPFTGPTAESILHQHLTGDPPTVRAARPTVPEAVGQVLGRVLGKLPADRYATAAEFAAALSQAVVPRAPGAGAGRVAVAARRRRLAAVALALAAVAASAVFVARRVFRGNGAAAGRPMVVVLPFENLGPSEEQYFADGITEEITSRLARIPRLGVIARTSANQYRRTEKTVRQIGAELGVDYVLEGSVRWEHGRSSASRVRISPQLIRVADETHLWAEPYEAALTGVFGLQAEIAERVAQGLDVTLLAAERRALRDQPTDNLDAYHYYLRAYEHLKRPTSRRDQETAIELYERATALDSGFAEAYARLAEAHAQMYQFSHDQTAARLAEAERAVQRAFALRRDLPEAHLAQGYLRMWAGRDYAGALEHFRTALAQRPNDADLLAAIAFAHRRRGEWDQHVAYLSRAIALDPRYHLYLEQLGGTSMRLRQFDAAERHTERALALAPDEPTYYYQMAWVYIRRDGDLERVRDVMQRALSRFGPDAIRFGELRAFRFLGEEFDRVLEGLALGPGIGPPGRFYLAKGDLFARRGLRERARAYYDSSRAAFTRAPADDAFQHSWLGWANAGLGRKEAAIREASMAVELLPVSANALEGADLLWDLAETYVRTGEYDAAIDRFSYLLTIPSGISVPLLRVDPLLEPLRRLPRFQQLVRIP
ncbi:MAG: protein kinase [Gemmatimonadetes bacterium]|nr:protein kinase [Gemmatimonadota bacterium]